MTSIEAACAAWRIAPFGSGLSKHHRKAGLSWSVNGVTKGKSLNSLEKKQ